MQNSPIGVFDSGIGGTTILKAVQNLLPHENFIYFGDSKNCPYGDKSEEELKKIVKSATEFLLDKKVKMVIVACNTATTRTISFLRETFPEIPFVGTEPAVKPACNEKFKNIFILATEGTVHSKRLNSLIKENMKPSQNITSYPLPGLAEAIETNDEAKINDCIASLKQNFSEEILNGADAVVLGCTHYPLALHEISAYFPNAEFFDSGAGVAHQTKKLLEEKRLLAEREDEGTVEYFFSN